MKSLSIDELIEYMKAVRRMHDNDSADTAMDDAVIAVLEGLPRPVKFVHKIGSKIVGYNANFLTVDDWMAKLREELDECEDEARQEFINEPRLAEELMDVITVCTSCMEALGIGLQERASIGKEVAEKNAQRGYFK